jgi:hypothetical protein
MTTNTRRRRYISAYHLDRVAIILAGQWEEVTSVVQKRAKEHHQQQIIALRQTAQQFPQQRHVA